MTIIVYNTLTKKKEDFVPVREGQVGIYLCGPTVYKPSHIGHAVGPVVFDVIRRWLEYREYRVKLVLNITDVDDKIIEESKRRGRSMKEQADEVTADYLRAMEKLNVRSPDVMPKATEHIPQIVQMVQTLIDKDIAYAVDGDVYFDVSKYPGYGRLSNRSVEEQEAETRELQSSTGKRHSWDFVLWKAAKPDEPSWESPWGKGRPGWHIECSAMSREHLGETFDIHGGGIDLLFPHHENEIAQSEAANDKPFVKYWLHNGLTRVNTKKMSKSLGNIRLISDLLDEYPGEIIRFFVISTHYHRPIDFSDEEIAKVAKGVQTFYRLFDRVKKITGQDPYMLDESSLKAIPPEKDSVREFIRQIEAYEKQFAEAMDNDFNTADAIAILYLMANEINHLIEAEKLTSDSSESDKQVLSAGVYRLRRLANMLGLFERPQETKLTDQLTGMLVQLLIDVRNEARAQKQFALSDMIRDRLKAMNIQLKDGKEGTTWEITL